MKIRSTYFILYLLFVILYMYDRLGTSRLMFVVEGQFYISLAVKPTDRANKNVWPYFLYSNSYSTHQIHAEVIISFGIHVP